MSSNITRVSPKPLPSWETLSPSVLKLIFSENVESQVKKDRLKQKVDKLARDGLLTKHFLSITSPKEQLEWAYRIFSAQMILGDYSWWGWETRSEWAWELSNKPWFYPRWNLKPCNLLVLAEQGIGDEILFASCFKDLEEINPGAIVECDSRLLPIFKRSFPKLEFQSRWSSFGVPKELTDDRGGGFDAFIPAGQLPKLWRTKRSDFPRVPYLKGHEKRVEVPEGAVGIVHVAGGFDEKEVDFWDLAEGVPINLHHRNKVNGVLNWYPEDFEDFLSLILSLKKVVCVPSAVAHFCGALGVECHIVRPPMFIQAGSKNNTILKYAYPRESGPMVWYGDHVKYFNSVRDYHYRMRRLRKVV